LKYEKKKWEKRKAEERKRKRKMPKWEKHMPSQVFLRIMRFLEFKYIFTKYASLNRQTRTILFKNYSVACKDRSINLNLGFSTKVIKKIPSYVQKRLNHIKIIFTPESTTEKISRVISFI
jgi:hypothetical protein